MIVLVRYAYVLMVVCLFFAAGCQSVGSYENYASVQIFTDNKDKTKINAGDSISFYYWVYKDTLLLMSSDMTESVTHLRLPAQKQLNKFEQPLLWLGANDSCIVQIKAAEARAELLSWDAAFEPNDVATFVYKVLKIES